MCCLIPKCRNVQKSCRRKYRLKTVVGKGENLKSTVFESIKNGCIRRVDYPEWWLIDLKWTGLHSAPHQTALIKSEGTGGIDTRFVKCFQMAGSFREQMENHLLWSTEENTRADPATSNGWNLMKTREIIKTIVSWGTVMRDIHDVWHTGG